MTFSVGKFFGGSKEKDSFSVKKSVISPDKLKGTPLPSKVSVYTVKNQVIRVEKLVSIGSTLKNRDIERRRKLLQNDKRQRKEDELEKKGRKKGDRFGLSQVPGKGIWDSIMRFLSYTFLGWFLLNFNRLIPGVMRSLSALSGIVGVIAFIGKVLIGGFSTWIKRGYALYDKVHGWIGDLGGENAQKTFEAFSKKLNTFINFAIIAGMISIGARGARRGPSLVPPIKRSGKLGRFFNRLNPFRTVDLSKPANKIVPFKRAAKTVTTTATKKGLLRSILQPLRVSGSKIPIIGGIIEFFLSWAMGDPIGKAAFRGAGATLLGGAGAAIGSLAPGLGTAIGLFLGSWLGAEVGGVLYDMSFGKSQSFIQPQTTNLSNRIKGIQSDTSLDLVENNTLLLRETIREVPVLVPTGA